MGSSRTVLNRIRKEQKGQRQQLEEIRENLRNELREVDKMIASLEQKQEPKQHAKPKKRKRGEIRWKGLTDEMRKLLRRRSYTVNELAETTGADASSVQGVIHKLWKTGELARGTRGGVFEYWAKEKANGKAKKQDSKSVSEKVLAEIHKRGPGTVGELAEAIGTTSKSLSSVVLYLYNRGLVMRWTNDDGVYAYALAKKAAKGSKKTNGAAAHA